MPLGRSSHARLSAALPRWTRHCVELWVFVYDGSGADLQWDMGLNSSSKGFAPPEAPLTTPPLSTGGTPWIRYYHAPGFKFGYFREALTPDATRPFEYVILVDADCTFDTCDIGTFLEHITSRRARLSSVHRRTMLRWLKCWCWK